MTDSKVKQCSKCKEFKPATSEYFVKSKRESDGFHSWCKVCKSEYRYEYNRRDKTKEINRIRQAEYRKKPEYQQYMSNYYQSPQYKKSKKNYNRKYYQQDKVKQRLKKYRKQDKYKQWQKSFINTPKQKERIRRYYQRQDVKLTQRMHSSSRRTAKNNLPNTLTSEQIKRMFEYFDYKCAVCDTPQDMFIKLELDHWIPLTSEDCTGTVATNIVPLCGGSQFDSHIGCNQSKGSKDAMEWLIEKYGKRKAKKIYQRIMDYFEWVREQ